jgi:hypothetical protein
MSPIEQALRLFSAAGLAGALLVVFEQRVEWAEAAGMSGRRAFRRRRSEEQRLTTMAAVATGCIEGFFKPEYLTSAVGDRRG